MKSFADKRTQELYANGKTKKCPAGVAPTAARKLEYVNLAVQLEDLKVPPGNRLHSKPCALAAQQDGFLGITSRI
ncbi:MAG TPA: hypothetical protein ENI00_11415 [Marinobacter antarcticus]|uniref:Uncharacterized protein n=1 Tax=Marinobacter antarcticus TaxID=564117 RepID=A0A831VVL9_9GAMM|nr:type II toxin-antitoxin system RelE/ParE family toxin [Marinobacter antarcticus]HEA52903.1 hypothetical protein [Marinobacter antarcticus]